MAEEVCVGGLVVALVLKRRQRRHRKRTVWCREWLQKRQKYGVYHQLLQELQLADRASYRNFLRMDLSSFEEILRVVGPKISRQDTHLREAISAGERLALTLRFLATGML